MRSCYSAIVFMFLLVMPVLLEAKVEGEYGIIRLDNGAEAIRYLPKGYRRWKRYPMLFALHGMGQGMHSAYNRWKFVADNLGYILVCPKASDFKTGYLRKPIDDRKNICAFWDYISDKYWVNSKKSILVGFSKGGNFALELGAIYPDRFRNVVCIFGFFGKWLEPIFRRKQNEQVYKNSKYYLITGKDDLTKTSLNYGYNVLQRNNIKSKIWVYSDMLHAYPEDLSNSLALIEKWLFYKGSGELELDYE